jgi:hypothetical protein
VGDLYSAAFLGLYKIFCAKYSETYGVLHNPLGVGWLVAYPCIWVLPEPLLKDLRQSNGTHAFFIP